MKDRNGKTLRKGDVVLSHIEDERFFGKAFVVENDPESYIFDDKNFCIRERKTGDILMKDIPAK